MMVGTVKKKEFGDFQTPEELTDSVVKLLKNFYGINPASVIEPCAGIGNFVISAISEFGKARFSAYDINPDYISILSARLNNIGMKQRVNLRIANFFGIDWKKIIGEHPSPVLILGNPPWITSSEMGRIRGNNMPRKSNIYNLRGIDALTGKSNFDISEWMLITLIKALIGNNGYIAFLCKTKVARKVFFYCNRFGLYPNISAFALHKINGKKHFGISAGTCLLFIKFRKKGICDFNLPGGSTLSPLTCGIYPEFTTDMFKHPGRYKPEGYIGYAAGRLIAEPVLFRDIKKYMGKSPLQWRSGVKHDAGRVFVLKMVEGSLINGLGEKVDVERGAIYPHVKSSDIANGRTENIERYIIITQKDIGSDPIVLKNLYPKLWRYLNKHADILDRRKSSVFRNRPRFSMFGIGPYTFKPFKLAVAGMYKEPIFRPLIPINDKPIIPDDTVYFVGFDTPEEIILYYSVYTDKISSLFFKTFIFRDEKRPITKNLLDIFNPDNFIRRNAESLIKKIEESFDSPDSEISPILDNFGPDKNKIIKMIDRICTGD